MQDRVAAEQAAGDAANADARAELDAEFDRLTNEMSQAIDEAIASFEQTLADAKAAQMASGADATNALNDFIDARLAIWAEKANAESTNAKWQEDSYYRYSLIRLLQAKQTAIDEAVAAAKADFAAELGLLRGQGQEFRNQQRSDFADFTADARDSLADIIAQDDEDMNSIITQREESLDEKLD